MVDNQFQLGNGPSGIAYDPENKKIYVTNTADDTVSVINTTTNTVVGSPIRVGNVPNDIAYDPENKRMYVVNRDDDTVSVIDTTTNTVIGNPIRVGNIPWGIAYHDQEVNKKKMYVGNQFR